MKYLRSPHFKKDHQTLPSDIQAGVHKAFSLFQQDSRHPSRRLKKMQGFDDIWEGHITQGYVFTMHWDKNSETGEAIAVFRRVGKHDEVYATP